MEHLPRDVQLKILGHADIDARRALGIYTKLRVPPRVRSLIARCLRPPSAYGDVQPHRCRSFRIPLGTRPDSTPIYILRREFGSVNRLHADDGWTQFLGRHWWNTWVLDNEHARKNARCPLQVDCVEYWCDGNKQYLHIKAKMQPY